MIPEDDDSLTPRPWRRRLYHVAPDPASGNVKREKQ